MKKVYMSPTCSLMVIIKMWSRQLLPCTFKNLHTSHFFIKVKSRFWALYHLKRLVNFLFLPLLCVYMSGG